MRPARERRRAHVRRPASLVRRVELVHLPGLEDCVRREVDQRLPGAHSMRTVPGRNDTLAMLLAGSLHPVLRLRTVVAPFLVLTFPVPRPRSLLSGEHLPRIADTIREACRLNPGRTPTSLRLDAAGRDSTVLRALAERLAQATGLAGEPDTGQCLVRLRRTPAGQGWDVLVRLSVLPLSARPWRVCGHPAAANATVAAAIADLTDPRDTDRVANLMCGSGTLLIERLLAAPAATAVGVDHDPDAVAAAMRNLHAARLSSRARLLTGDIRDDQWLEHGPFDVLLADPPWGDKAGRHHDHEALHLALLERVHAGAAPAARFAVLTHQVRAMDRCLTRTAHLWRLRSQTRVFHKGHHPRIYLLTRQP